MRFIRLAAAIVLSCAFVAAAFAAGKNTGFNGTFDWNTFGDTLMSVFGGVNQLGLAVLALVGVLIFVWVVYTLGARKHNLIAALVALVLLIAALVFARSLEWNFLGDAVPVLVFIVLVTAGTILVVAIAGPVSLPQRKRFLQRKSSATTIEPSKSTEPSESTTTATS